jgi:hypothetical protein
MTVAALALFAVPEDGAPPPAAPEETASAAHDGTACLASVLCALKRTVGEKGDRNAWSPERCQTLAEGLVEVSARYDLSPALLLAVMVHESDLDENAVSLSQSRGALAKDSGLMGIRCVLDGRGRCSNGLVRGMAWREVMDPLTNVELGARYLAHYRDIGGRQDIKVRSRDAEGRVQTGTRSVRCRHRDHAYWAHYNHGTRYNARGAGVLYPERVAVLYDAFARALDVEASDLRGVDAGRRAASRVGKRTVELAGIIERARNVCAAAPAGTST